MARHLSSLKPRAYTHVGIPVILEEKGLLHVHLLIDWPVEEIALHVHLVKLKGMVSSIG
jgi:hypothetical protein